jgi:hypothetical protein
MAPLSIRLATAAVNRGPAWRVRHHLCPTRASRHASLKPRLPRLLRNLIGRSMTPVQEWVGGTSHVLQPNERVSCPAHPVTASSTRHVNHAPVSRRMPYR